MILNHLNDVGCRHHLEIWWDLQEGHESLKQNDHDATPATLIAGCVLDGTFRDMRYPAASECSILFPVQAAPVAECRHKRFCEQTINLVRIRL